MYASGWMVHLSVYCKCNSIQRIMEEQLARRLWPASRSSSGGRGTQCGTLSLAPTITYFVCGCAVNAVNLGSIGRQLNGLHLWGPGDTTAVRLYGEFKPAPL